MLNKILRFVLRIFFGVFFFLSPSLKDNKSLNKALKLYDDKSFTGLFAKIRAWDAPYEEIGKNIPKKGKIVDLGSGDGLLVNYLAIESKKRELIGIEINKKRLKESFKGLKNTSFQSGNILKVNLSNSDCVLLIHVLHHLPSLNDQEKLIKKIYQGLKKGNKLIIVEIAEKPIIKYLFTWITDAFIVPILFEGKSHDFSFHYRNSKEWKKVLEDNGFKTKIQFANKGMPFSHIIFICIPK